ncbi:DUF456 domain-containing protein [Alkalibacillus sp. S2W]|uniref:DUF456 domain-containing protein n=1 Tax=Alkalibacillus TaxID=331654 RepID=UPI0014202E5A|nr:DUF456 family protein [Alkalibacillus almallahensis]NIK12084.1 hypothetical protein [Alkalibacillus almallahensis]
MEILDIIWWIAIIALFALSYAGVIFPVIPAPIVLWAGFFVYQFGVNSDELTWVFWLSMAILTIVLIVADIIANSYFVKRYGGSKLGEWTAAAGVIVGSFVIPPFGILIVPAVAVFVVELMQNRQVMEALRAVFGSLIGFLSGALAKFVVVTIMVVWFFIVIIF